MHARGPRRLLPRVLVVYPARVHRRHVHLVLLRELRRAGAAPRVSRNRLGRRASARLRGGFTESSRIGMGGFAADCARRGWSLAFRTNGAMLLTAITSTSSGKLTSSSFSVQLFVLRRSICWPFTSSLPSGSSGAPAAYAESSEELSADSPRARGKLGVIQRARRLAPAEASRAAVPAPRARRSEAVLAPVSTRVACRARGRERLRSPSGHPEVPEVVEAFVARAQNPTRRTRSHSPRRLSSPLSEGKRCA